MHTVAQTDKKTSAWRATAVDQPMQLNWWVCVAMDRLAARGTALLLTKSAIHAQMS